MPLPLESKLDRQMIRAFIEDFYGRVRRHDVLGPIFEERLAGHWESHFERLTDFWMTVLGGVPAYKGNPFGVHHKVVREGNYRMEEGHFELWLTIFEASSNAMLSPDLATVAQEKARRIADSLRQGLFFRIQAAE